MIQNAHAIDYPPFIGWTRFSLYQPGSGSWQITRGTADREDEYKRHLFSESRLDARIKTFLEVSVPQLAIASRGFPYKHVIAYSSELPTKYKEALKHASSVYPFLILNEHVGTKPSQTFEDIVRTYIDKNSVFGFFNLDDDDILSLSYFDQMSGYIKRDFQGYRVSLARGLTAILEKGRFWLLSEKRLPLINIGLLQVCNRDNEGQIHLPPVSGHDRVDRVGPVILDSQQLSFVHVQHAEQDTIQSTQRDRLQNRLLDLVGRFPAHRNEQVTNLDFPFMATKLGSTNELQLLTSKTPLSEEIELPFGNKIRAFDIEIEWAADTISVDHAARVELHILDLEDQKSTDRVPVHGQGLIYVPGTGYHFTGRISKNYRVLRQRIILESSHYCKGITIVPSSDSTKSGVINSVVIKEYNLWRPTRQG